VHKVCASQANRYNEIIAITELATTSFDCSNLSFRMTTAALLLL
jgi:hypothetical protein